MKRMSCCFLLALLMSLSSEAGLQEEIDRASQAGGGRVNVPAGIHACGTIYLRSHVELHLEAGAVLLGGAHAESYDDVTGPSIDKHPEYSDKAFIVCTNGEDIAITGEGTIDGQGPLFYDRNAPLKWNHYPKPAQARTRMIEFVNCRGIKLEGVTLKDSPGWTVWMRKCQDIEIGHLTIVGDQKMMNNDGLHLDTCRHVRVGDCSITTGDDSFVMRANPGVNDQEVISEDFIVSNCVFNSTCQGLRLGCPSDGTIRNAIFTNITFKGVNGVTSYHPLRYLQRGNRGRCKMENLLITDSTIDVSGVPILFGVEPGITLRSFGNTTFRNITIHSGKPVQLKGTAESPLVNVQLNGVPVADTPSPPTPFTWTWNSNSWEVEP